MAYSPDDVVDAVRQYFVRHKQWPEPPPPEDFDGCEVEPLDDDWRHFMLYRGPEGLDFDVKFFPLQRIVRVMPREPGERCRES
jgi:hypothetical protein